MATWRTILNVNAKLSPNLRISIRNGHHLRGKPPGIARSLEQRMEGTLYT